jgi:DNA-binding transcriptional regulator YiaG
MISTKEVEQSSGPKASRRRTTIVAKNKKRQSGTAVAEPETATESDGSQPVEATVDSPGGRRLPHVEPEQFKALRDELKMSNKDMAAAIGRTLARVSELTTSQGASIETWNRVEKQMRDWREQNPIGADGTEPSES